MNDAPRIACNGRGGGKKKKSHPDLFSVSSKKPKKDDDGAQLYVILNPATLAEHTARAGGQLMRAGDVWGDDSSTTGSIPDLHSASSTDGESEVAMRDAVVRPQRWVPQHVPQDLQIFDASEDNASTSDEINSEAGAHDAPPQVQDLRSYNGIFGTPITSNEFKAILSAPEVLESSQRRGW